MTNMRGDTEREHFAIGLIADIRDGAKPAGWGDEPFTEDVPKYRSIEAVSGSEAGHPYGTFMVGGWYWSPLDLEEVR